MSSYFGRVQSGGNEEKLLMCTEAISVSLNNWKKEVVSSIWFNEDEQCDYLTVTVKSRCMQTKDVVLFNGPF